MTQRRALPASSTLYGVNHQLLWPNYRVKYDIEETSKCIMARYLGSYWDQSLVGSHLWFYEFARGMKNLQASPKTSTKVKF